MTDGEALFRAVCEQPREDTPRLAYADWLDEHGRPERAAFIRFQCEFPDWSAVHAGFAEVLARDAEFDPHLAGWRAELPRSRGVAWKDRFFERGFVNAVDFHSTRAFADRADAVFAAAPVEVAEVKQVTDRTSARVLASPYLGRLRQLVLTGRYGDGAVRSVAQCPGLARLDSLCLWGRCSDAGAEALAASPCLTGLTCLSFSNHTLTDRGVLALADSAALKGVTRLVLNRTRGLSQRVVRRLKERFGSVG